LSSDTPSPREVLDRLPAHFRPDVAGDTNATIHLELTGAGGGQWTMRVADGRCEVLDGLVGMPQLSISALAEDYVSLVEGELSPVTAFMQGRVKVSGDIGLAVKMQSWFRRPEGL
jgi:putative sterol carrier protein